jgi:hypothetical protein
MKTSTAERRTGSQSEPRLTMGASNANGRVVEWR